MCILYYDEVIVSESTDMPLKRRPIRIFNSPKIEPVNLMQINQLQPILDTIHCTSELLQVPEMTVHSQELLAEPPGLPQPHLSHPGSPPCTRSIPPRTWKKAGDGSLKGERGRLGQGRGFSVCDWNQTAVQGPGEAAEAAGAHSLSPVHIGIHYIYYICSLYG